MNCLPIVPRALLAAFLSLSVLAHAQEPATDAKQLRREANAAVQAKNFDVAAADFKKLTELDAKDGNAWHMLGYSLHMEGKLDDALVAHKKAAAFPQFAGPSTYNIACVYAMKGNPDEAFAWLDKAIAAGFADAELASTDSDLDSLRKDARFAKFETAVKANTKMAKPKAAKMQVFAPPAVERKNARVVWFSEAGSPAQISIDYSPVSWKDEYEKGFASGEYQGQKWRLGSDFWTRIDTWVDLHFGDVVVPAGYYYLTLEQRDAKTFVLAFHDPAAIRKQKLDGFLAAKVKGGIEVPMQHSGKASITKALDINIGMTEGSQKEGEIGIEFGGHRLAANFAVTIE